MSKKGRLIEKQKADGGCQGLGEGGLLMGVEFPLENVMKLVRSDCTAP